MDKGLLLIGVVLIAIGAIGFFMGESMLDSPWSGVVTNYGHITRLLGIVLVFGGIIVSIVGAVEKEKPKK